MSQAVDLLNSLSGDDVVTYAANAEDEHIIIGSDRFIRIPDALKRLGVQHDKDIETVTFDCPRYWDKHDLSQMVIYVNYVLPTGENGRYPVKNVVAIGKTMHFDWTISDNVTQYQGQISFLICAVTTDEEGNEKLHWNSELNQEAYISEGLECTESPIHKYPDIITHLLTRMDEVEAIATPEAMQTYTDTWLEKNHARILTEIEAKGKATLDTIPADYTETHNMAEESVRTKGDAIVGVADGNTIVVSDSSDDHLRSLRIFGKSTQTVTVGKNLFKNGFASGYTETVKGVTFTVNADGSIRAKGTPTGAIAYNIFEGEVLPIGNYYISGAPASASQKFRLQVNLNESGTERTGGVDMGSGAKFSVDASVTSLRGYIYVASDAGSVEGIFYPQIELGTAATPYEPYTNGKPSPDPDCPQEITSVENPEIHIFGKNILKFDHADNYLPTSVTLIEEFESGAILKGSDGAVPGGSTYSSGWYQVCYNNRIPLKAGTYVTLSADYTVLENPHSTTANISMHFSAKNSYSLTDSVARPADGVKTRISRTVLIEKDDEYFFTIGLNSCTVRIENIQLELNDIMTGYEPYIDRQNIILAGTLSGVPVYFGGNYTDANGKQWLCDEIDLERGVYVQRVIKKTFSASVNEAWRVYNVHSQKTHTAYQESKLCGDMRVFPGTASDIAALISNEYIALPLTEVYNNGTQGISASNISPAIRMCVDACQGYSVDEFKAWLEEHPFELAYPIATPIETPLTAEELAAFKALKTNYPNTTVLNDSGAHMELKYNADTKTYVDAKIAACIPTECVGTFIDEVTGVVYRLKVSNGKLMMEGV